MKITDRQKLKEVSIISEKFLKYIITLKLLNNEYFIFWGTDLNEKDQDKLLLDQNGNIITMIDKEKIFLGLKKYEKEIKFFDLKNFSNWRDELSKFCQINSINEICYSKYDLDKLIGSLVINNLLKTEITPIILKEYVDFINLIDDYAYQTNDSNLLKLTHEKNIRYLWNYSYDNYLFNIADSKRKRLENEKLNEEKFKKNFIQIVLYLILKLRII